MEISQFCEFFMLFAFGFSWPFAIARTYKAGHSGAGVAGKSPMFMIIVLLGYVGGILARYLDANAANDWLCFVYVVDMMLVSTDLSLYLYYSSRARRGAYDAETVLRVLRRSVLADGRVDAAEAEMLRRVAAVYATKNNAAAAELVTELDQVLADGKVTQEESERIAALFAKI